MGVGKLGKGFDKGGKELMVVLGFLGCFGTDANPHFCPSFKHFNCVQLKQIFKKLIHKSQQ